MSSDPIVFRMQSSQILTNINSNRPHAYTTNGNWDIDEVSQLYIVNQLAGTRIYSLNGTDRLKSTSSIMHIDQSQDWSINPILRSANVLVDPESVNLLAELYKSPPVVDILEESIRSSPEWSQYTRTTKNLFYIDLKGGFKTNAHRIIGALTHFELGDNSKYQASACFDLAPGFKPAIGTVDAGYLIDEVKGRYACFDSSDNRIQIGWECMWNIRLKGKSGAWEAAAPGESFDQPCTFTTPFKAPPTVVAFIFRFSSQYTTSNPSLRISAGVGTTTTTGFTIRVNTFGGKSTKQNRHKPLSNITDQCTPAQQAAWLMKLVLCGSRTRQMMRQFALAIGMRCTSKLRIILFATFRHPFLSSPASCSTASTILMCLSEVLLQRPGARLQDGTRKV